MTRGRANRILGRGRGPGAAFGCHPSRGRDQKEILVRSISHIGAVALVLPALLLGVGCSDDSNDSSSASSNPASNTQPENNSGDNEADNKSDAPHEAEIPTIANANWSGGNIHVEVTGDREATFDSTGSGATLDGVTSAAFTQPPNTVSIGLGGSEESAISLTAGGVSTVGGFRTNCTIDFTKNEASSIAADFECNDLQAVSTSATDTYTIDVKGNFTLTK
jgi:hypothetical protein